MSAHAVVEAAVRVADAGGLGAVSMRGVGRELGVEAMSLYHHVRNKEHLLDALTDWIFTQVELPLPEEAWRPAMERRATSARAALAAHPWALGLVESRRTPGPALLRHHDAVLGCLRTQGFGARLAAHAFSAIDAYVYGFVLVEQTLPFEAGESAGDFAAALELPDGEYPHLAESARTLTAEGDYDYADEFGYGLDLLLEGLAGRLDAERSRR
ncbi:TetR/AcrR family transcriptional regulator C-terminal domain-containing protein [Nocardioides nanhaiensis]|uniref:TetR/AcrR family transcriptional regulator C-terminal domain-containing protein n=1 Tax=Nocardioides nanhaiensis TaxID=1476871 RepID=A0ABP8VPG4_9ACTN